MKARLGFRKLMAEEADLRFLGEQMIDSIYRLGC
jgi:hypothetical protein